MSNVLLVKGHPLTSETSFSVKGLEAFKAAYQAANPNDTITVLDVFADNVPEIDADIASAFNTLAAGGEFGALSPEQQAKVWLKNRGKTCSAAERPALPVQTTDRHPRPKQPDNPLPIHRLPKANALYSEES